MTYHITYHVNRLVDDLHAIDMAIADGAFATDDSLSAIYLQQSEAKLRTMADRVASQRERMLGRQPAFQFLQAAE